MDDRVTGRRRRRVLVAMGIVALAAAVLIDVDVTGPRVAVEWRSGLGEADRSALEARYDLRNGENEGASWSYELGDWSSENIEALVRERAVSDTGYIDRDAFTAGEPRRRLRVRTLPFPFGSDSGFPDARQLFQVQSLWLLLAGGALLASARSPSVRTRRLVGVAALLGVGAAMFMFPLSPTSLRMGDANTYTASREAFETYTGVREIRYEAHLSHAIVGRLYGAFGASPDAPDRALNLLMYAATAWFLVCGLGLGMLEGWSPLVARYLGLALLAPAALFYFRYREFGYLSLNVAAFPLVARGLASGSVRLEVGSLLFGLGAALHGFGILSLAGSWLAAFAARLRFAERVRAALRMAAWGIAAYLGWIAIYVVILELPVSTGHAAGIPWRPVLTSEISRQGNRLNPAIVSALGARDLLFTAWMVGAPLLVVALSLWRRYRDELRLALCYAVPSLAFMLFFWPIQGLGVDTDLVVAAFPAFYALAWVCAHDARSTAIAATLLVSAHLAFWRVVLDARFVNLGLD